MQTEYRDSEVAKIAMKMIKKVKRTRMKTTIELGRTDKEITRRRYININNFVQEYGILFMHFLFITHAVYTTHDYHHKKGRERHMAINLGDDNFIAKKV